ncbi:HTH-type transcriptional repressor CytR [Tessaracoccus lapidicaptus]|nr:HTH-type transcriptional repressor CytR [Tessaracoccus lapidicaptus]
MGQMLLLSAVEAAARDHGYSPRVITTSDTDAASLRRALETLHNERVEGIVVMGNTTLHVRGAIWAAGRTPVVLVASDEPPAERLSTVSVNQAGGARELLLHLRAHGPRIGHIAGPRGWVDADARREEWRRFAGDEHAHLVAEGDWTAGSGYAAMQRLLDQGVDAVFASNDYMALGALQACRERGLSVPGDVAVTGFDDIPGADFFYPPLTTVRQPFRELGIRAVDLLAELLSGQEARSELLQAELVVRSSS